MLLLVIAHISTAHRPRPRGRPRGRGLGVLV